jgi:biotin carboxyl carrier protein
MKARLELVARPVAAGGAEDEARSAGLLLCAPTVGVLTQALPEGRALTPGAPAGVLLQLGRVIELVTPPGVCGRVVSARPERVHRPVGYGEVLYALAPFAAGAGDEEGGVPADAAVLAGGASGSSAPALRAPYAGRFWARPAPGDPAFVSAGDVLASGATVGLLEVMKTFTQVHYEPAGDLPARARVVRVVPADGADVSAGDALVEVEPA